jgi:integrase
MRPVVPIFTHRLFLRPLAPADAPALLDYHGRSDVHRFLPTPAMNAESGGLTEAEQLMWKPLTEIGVGPHDLRRVSATQLAASGVDLRTLMNRMGHKTAKLALEVYAQADPIADRAAADTIGLHVLNAMSHLKRTEASGSESPSRTQ